MELGFPLWRDGMLIATDGVPPLHADESGGARLPIVEVAAWLVPLGCQKGSPTRPVGLRCCCGTCAAPGSSKGQPNETCGVEMLWNV